MSDDWFVNKRYGYGFTPIRWQGMVLTAVYVVALVTDINLMRAGAPKWIIAVALSVAFFGIAASKTRGGLRWRWGDRDQ